jgi:DNA helicase II / ATP-dependent DNA helicase PcrA
MPITSAQAAQAEQAQWQAASDPAPQVRLIAGPGTGKSATIERRIAHVLNNGADPERVCVISFTRATCAELRVRIAAFCATQPCAATVGSIRISTMHSLALRLLRAAAVLATLYPSDPLVLDDWEREHLYDLELAATLGCSPTRAGQIRLAHDAQWQTLNPQLIAQPPITSAQALAFNAFHATRRNLYSCVLPGEVIYECVTRIQQGAMQLSQLPPIDHLIVDEYQDLNACDQEFVRLLVSGGARLFIAGDDDQSIYSFRHANPTGIVQFNATYPAAATHTLDACFRCTPAVLTLASRMIAVNPGRLAKSVHSLYAQAAPPLQGAVHIWSFPTAADEAQTIALSCQRLISGGMAGQEDQILILISNRRLQLNPISQELANLGLPFDPPGGQAVRDEEGIRAAYSILRIVKDQAAQAPDYVAHRTLLAQLHGIGMGTGRGVGDLCVANNQNFRDLFYLSATPHWLTGRPRAAVARVQAVIQQVNGWTLQDTIGIRAGDIESLLRNVVFVGSARVGLQAGAWAGFGASLPPDMTLEEVLGFLGADDEAEQRQILNGVNVRLGGQAAAMVPVAKRLRILTMHGAKGLSGKVVFIPSAEQGIMPSFRAIHATGLLNEQRRLFYVSITRAKGVCVLSHSALHVPPESFLIQQSAQVRLPRSQFLNEMSVSSVNRVGGFTPPEIAQIMGDVNNL